MGMFDAKESASGYVDDCVVCAVNSVKAESDGCRSREKTREETFCFVLPFASWGLGSADGAMIGLGMDSVYAGGTGVIPQVSGREEPLQVWRSVGGLTKVQEIFDDGCLNGRTWEQPTSTAPHPRRAPYRFGKAVPAQWQRVGVVLWQAISGQFHIYP